MMKDVCNMTILWIGSDGLLYGIAVLYVVVTVFYAYYLITRTQERKEKKNKEITFEYELLEKNILSGAIQDAYGLNVIYKIKFNNDFESFVRGFLHHALANHDEQDYQKGRFVCSNRWVKQSAPMMPM